jgi:branched-chain amino acid transport system substrate-binding protein
MRLALTQVHNRVGRMKVRLIVRDSAVRGGGAWSAIAANANAQAAALDPDAVFYVGDLSDGATEITAPIVNGAGIAQVSPGSTYIGLTNAVKGVTGASEPKRYDPSGTRTFLRLQPSDAVEAAAMVTELKQDGCHEFAIAHDNATGDWKLAELIDAAAHHFGLAVAANDYFAKPGFGVVRSYLQQLEKFGAHCVALAAQSSPGIAQLTAGLATNLAGGLIVGGSGVCNGSWLAGPGAGVSDTASERLRCVAAQLPLAHYVGGSTFKQLWSARYPGQPASWEGLTGYATAQLAIDALSTVSAGEDLRAEVRRSLFSGVNHATVMGQLSFSRDGNVEGPGYGLFRVSRNGEPIYVRTLMPASWVG